VDEIFNRLKPIITEQLGVKEEEIKPDSHFSDDLGADSLDVVEMIMVVEEVFDIKVSDEDAEQITTVQNLIDYIERQVKNSAETTPSQTD